MEDLKDLIAKNLVELRTQAKLTQLQLAEMLNYSDKAVSKWERGEAIPDVRVLIQISEIYGVTLDQLVRGNDLTEQVKPRRKIYSSRVFISALSSVLVWFVATCVFLVFFFIPVTRDFAYLAFVVAPLPTGIVLCVFSAKWGNHFTNALFSTLILWSIVLIFHIYVITFSDFTQIYFLYIGAAVFEVLIILWFVYRWHMTRKK